MGTRKMMKLLDPATGLMECKVCGNRHAANIKPRSKGHYYHGSWQCRYGCKYLDEGRVWNGFSKTEETLLK